MPGYAPSSRNRTRAQKSSSGFRIPFPQIRRISPVFHNFRLVFQRPFLWHRIRSMEAVTVVLAVISGRKVA